MRPSVLNTPTCNLGSLMSWLLLPKFIFELPLLNAGWSAVVLSSRLHARRTDSGKGYTAKAPLLESSARMAS